MESYKDFVLEQLKAGEAITGLYHATKDEFLQKSKIRQEKNHR